MAAPIYDPLARAWVDVDLAAVVRNARWLAARARVPLLPMVKADGYGVGAVAVARALAQAADVPLVGFGVAAVSEAAALRDAGITAPIHCFSPLWGADLPAARALGVIPSFGHPAELQAWQAAGGGPWQLSIDTGMSRAGASATTLLAAPDAPRALRDACEATPPVGVFTHFHSADEGLETVTAQEARFRAVLDGLALPAAVARHAENSAAILVREGSPWQLARPGVALYGAAQGLTTALAPVVHLRARVVDLRDVAAGETVSYGATWMAPGARRIATIALGYADGYRRHLSNRGVALLHGHRVPVVGRVTMDLTMLDVTDVPCALGDVVTVLGRDGDACLTVDDVAALGGLSPYELLTGLRARPDRRVVA